MKWSGSETELCNSSNSASVEGLHQETSDRDGNCNIITFNFHCVCSYVECLMISGVKSDKWKDWLFWREHVIMMEVSVFWLCISTVKFVFFSFFLSELRSLFHLHSVQCQKTGCATYKATFSLACFYHHVIMLWAYEGSGHEVLFVGCARFERWLCVSIFMFIVTFMSVELRCTEHCFHEHSFFFLQCTGFIYSSTTILSNRNFVNLPSMLTKVETSVEAILYIYNQYQKL